MAGELLNTENQVPEDVHKYLNEELLALEGKFVGFKLHCNQMSERNITFDQILQYIGPEVVIVLWRKSVVEQFCSLKIAEKTGIWFRTPEENKASVDSLELTDEEISGYYEYLIDEWKAIGNQWPINLVTVYVCYEDLIADPLKELKTICSSMGCDMESYKSKTISGQLITPIPPEKRITNWDQMSEQSKSLSLNVKQILRECIDQNLHAQCPTMPFLPDPEPPVPSNGWVYQVSAPFMPNEAKDNVSQALASGSVSSAGFWPKQMSIKLKQIFETPVAQPCSNGFTGLLLSMQTIGLREGDEVIMPALTMIAVPNAVHFVGAIPVFADCAPNDYNPGLKEILEVSSDKTRAIVLTHTYGVPTPDLQLIVKECEKRDWILIEDISECVGVKVNTTCGQQLLGTFGQLSAASLYANKIVHSGDGGFVLARDAKHGARLKSLANHGFTPNYHFLHFESAVNAKINGLGAALAVGCLDQMAQVLEHRHQLAHWYRKYLKDLPIVLMPECGAEDTPWVFGIQCTSQAVRTQLRAYLALYGFETRDYFFPLHFQPAYLSPGKSCPRAEVLGATGFYLPTFYGLREMDIIFITDCIKEYFNPNNNRLKSLSPPERPLNESLSIRSESLRVEVNQYTKSGQLVRTHSRGHHLIRALELSLEANNLLITENWSEIRELIESVEEVLKVSNNSRIIEDYFKPFVAYFQTLSSFEPTAQRPWICEDLNAPEYEMAGRVATTSDSETLQLLVWIIKQFKPRYVLELGSWMGHSSLLMAIATKTYETTDYKAHIYACDAFEWQHWMSNYVYSRLTMSYGKSFLARFESNTEVMSDIIEPIVMDFSQGFPKRLKQIKPDFVFIDCTQQSEELDIIWEQLEPMLTSNKTIIVFNGLSVNSLPFLTRESHKLKSIAKPHSIAKAYIYSPEEEVSQVVNILTDVTPKLQFQTPPDWTHHHKNAFNSAIDRLRDELHDKNANILFIPAVEQTLCDSPEIMKTNHWIGIIHMTVHYPTLFYIPDLKRLCGEKYRKYMQNCKGLYTLTALQSQYLKQNLKLDYQIPIQPLTYPFAEPLSNSESSVIDLLLRQQTVELILIGGFARDYPLFESAIVPKCFKKVVIINDKNVEQLIGDNQNEHGHIELRDRLPDDDYEQLLYKCIPFLCLKYYGAANTLLLECIARNIAILVPNMESCVEYIGENYPLLYDTKQSDFTQLLTIESIQSAIDYLKSMNKIKFGINSFINCVKSGIVLQSLPKEKVQNSIERLIEPRHEFPQYDVTLLICSYKRTHHLSAILDSLWNGQSYEGKVQIIVWNNNDSRMAFVKRLCNKYLIESNSNKSLELIASTRNYFCSVRLSVPQLMQSQCLLICDDDCIPGPEFVQFFMNGHNKYPNDILCLRGHQFFEHTLNDQKPNSFWEGYEYKRFIDDQRPEQLIHFVHADTCLVPKSALLECASVPMPDPSFALVDDYWMSYVLSHRFERNLRKLSAKQLGLALVERTEDSDDRGVALYTRPDVNEARLRLYIHHMLQEWPQWEDRSQSVVDEESLLKSKTEFWNQLFVGYNISSKIDETGIEYLKQIGVKCVRIGAVVGDRLDYEFNQFVTNPRKQMIELKKSIALLKSRDIKTVVTLLTQISGPDIWRFIADSLRSEETVVGYDLINEPFTQFEKGFGEVAQNDHEYKEFTANYIEMIKAIRQVDQVTPIILESSYWAHIDTVPKLAIDSLLSVDTNILVSFHFYSPQLLTQRRKNRNRYSFPTQLPVYELAKHSEMITIDETFIANKFEKVIEWSVEHGVKVVLGEFGISRDISGAQSYLECILKHTRNLGISSFVYSFRDDEWESMDYEFGTDINTGTVRIDLGHNTLMQTIVNGIEMCNKTNQ